jgi:hypothetical protein
MPPPPHRDACAPGGDENQGKGQPGSGDAPEHVKAFLDEQCDHKEIHGDDHANKCGCGAERRPGASSAKVDPGDGCKNQRSSHIVYDERPRRSGDRHACKHGGSAKRPACKRMDDYNPNAFGEHRRSPPNGVRAIPACRLPPHPARGALQIDRIGVHQPDGLLAYGRSRDKALVCGMGTEGQLCGHRRFRIQRFCQVVVLVFDRQGRAPEDPNVGDRLV